MPIQECQQSTTSTEFLEWQEALRVLDWEERNKVEYYLAQLTAEVRRFREGFMERPASVSVEECLMDFGTSGRPAVQEVIDREPSATTGEQTRYEIGPDLVKDPKWAEVNRRAKMTLAMQLGFDPDIWLEQDSNA